jgi:hypothetical protein
MFPERNTIKEALTDSIIGLFGLYRDANGKLWITCNGGKFHKYETEND